MVDSFLDGKKVARLRAVQMVENVFHVALTSGMSVNQHLLSLHVADNMIVKYSNC